MNYWIFVSVPFTDFNRGNMHELLKKTEASLKWTIGKRTHNRSKLSKGDAILFYQGRDESQKIFGSAELASQLQQINESENYVEIRYFVVWDKPVKIKPLINKLSFIKNKKHWGLYLHGGIVKISEKDHNLILNEAERRD